MKKQVLILLLLSISLRLSAQTRLSLYEEFTGEQCFACAATNPGLQSLLAANASKVLHITYQSPLPVAGPIYTAYRTVTDARLSYYGITTAPQARLDGTQLGTGSAFPGNPGHPGNTTQADIDAEATLPAPLNITVSHSWNSTGDSVTVSINVTAPAAYTPSGASLKLRVAIIERLQYNAPPGINGEQIFPNVVREMYPSAAGTAIANTWTMGQTMTYTIKGRVPRFVDKEVANIAVWIQNDAIQNVVQAAVSSPVPIPVDASVPAIRPPAKLICVAGSAMVPSVATLRNAGTTTLTSAKIYYRADNGALNLYNWSGSLGPGGSTIISLLAISVSGGNHYITDSVVMPNGGADINAGNNVAAGQVSIYNTIGGPLPVATGFEGTGGAIPAGWVLYDADSNGRNFVVTRNIFGGNAGYNNSTYFLMHNNYYVPAGETNYAILPAANLPNGSKLLVFAQAHAQYGTENDKLDVVYSTDCGANWTSVWSAAGASLATAPPTTAYFIPKTAEWATRSVDMSAVPYGAMIAFRAISDFGNSLYIDNVQLSSPAGVEALGSLRSVSVFPNPAGASAMLDFTLAKPGKVSIDVLDATGRSVVILAEGDMQGGTQHLKIPLTALAAGMYSIRMRSEDGTLTRRLSVIR